MKRITRILCLLLSLLLLAGCAPKQTTTEKALDQIHALGVSPDDNYRTFYEIFVYSFCDSNGDGIGDLQGVISKLDYLQELGITGIWLMPVHPSQSYHKYDVADYYAIDPAYGTMEDMDALLSECEKRGIKVILDLVLNHTGNNHPWFLAACDYLRNLPEGAVASIDECPYLNYYYFGDVAGTGDHPVEGSSWYYEGKFSPHMPDLKLHSPEVREEIAKIVEFWLNKGVHGFRLDAVKEFYSGNPQANAQFLSWLQETAAAIKPDVYLVGEAWDGFGALQQYYESGISSFFAFPFGTGDGKIAKVLRNAGNESIVTTYATALETADSTYFAIHPDYIDAPFLSNHDVGRIAGFVNRDENKTKLAGAMNILMSGSCFIYYGEEIGMIGSGNDPSKRAPMYWNPERNNGTTNPPPECELPEEYPFGSLEEQEQDDTSIYNYYRQAIAIRNSIPAIARGRTTEEKQLNRGCISAMRKSCELGECILLMNISPESATVDLSDYSSWTLAAKLSADGGEIALTDNALTLPPYGTAVLTQK